MVFCSASSARPIFRRRATRDSGSRVLSRHARAPPSGAVERCEQLIARALAAPALLGAQATVLVVLGVALAFLGAGAARCQACLQRRPLRIRVRGGLAAEDAPGDHAGVGAVET